MTGSSSGWQVLAQTVTGNGKKVNQDRCGSEAHDGGRQVMLSVADGHGSAGHARSDTGAELAVRAFSDAAGRFRASLRPGQSLRQVKARAEDDLPRDVVREWQRRVDADLAARPAGEDPSAARMLYGTTLIGALITDQLVLGWQVGDGDLCVIDEDGHLATPLRPAATQLGDDTDSLCSQDAEHLMRLYWAPRAAIRAPVLIALSTDGLSKSFVSFDGYEAFITGVLGILREKGAAAVGEALPGWLGQASSFSGDDATLVLAWRDTAATA